MTPLVLADKLFVAVSEFDVAEENFRTLCFNRSLAGVGVGSSSLSLAQSDIIALVLVTITLSTQVHMTCLGGVA